MSGSDKNGQKEPLLEAGTETGEVKSAAVEFVEMSGMAVQLSSTRIVRILLTIIDSAFLGHLGTKQLAGVALSAMWQGVPSTFVQFTLQAITPLASQARGAGKNKLVGEWWQCALLIAVVGCIPVMVVFWNVHLLVGMTMKDEETLDYAKRFSRIMMWTLLPQFLYVASTSYFATIGVVMPATVCTVLTVIANVFFNQCFIYGFDPSKWHTATGWFEGSPWATVASSWMQLTLFLLWTVVIKKSHREFWGGWSAESISPKRMKQFLALGVPTGLSSVVDWMSGAIAGSFSGWAGVRVAAGQNVLNGLFALTYSTVSGFSTATQIRLARYLGENNPEAAKRILKIGSSTLITGGLIVCAVVGIWHRSVWGVWTDDQDLKDDCDGALASFMAGVMAAYVRFTLTIVMSSLGPKEATLNLVANNIASWCIYIPLAYIMPLGCNVCLHMGLPGFWWSDFFGEAFKVAVLTWGVSRVDWAQAARDARAGAASSPNPKENEQAELAAFTSVGGSFASPSGNTGSGNVAMHSPGLLVSKRDESFQSAGLKTSDGDIDWVEKDV